ncbi:MarR family winged helix-turn-helix transcriptional regulator [Marinobacterium rhizophilum]|uniref:Winged helix-turn-helix transcriptional regulator n=1 Tax=Marinobacterium rhizophilum TaxID=420402 RepID=A0ABY5HP28_9GAMM|nr:MarR family winged helix-turn-helix transcriptional regulator [Marinobacterium rhizophilum]UTW12651.1 winged helix-turn-helix transcriptional regulator [Marinobacterium rhizophilum]
MSEPTDSTPKSLILNQFIPYRMVNLARRMSEDLSRIYGSDAYGVSIPEWRILARLAEDQSLNSRDLGRITQMDKSKVSRGVKQLDERGYLVKRKDPQDNRATYLSLSPEGLALYQELAPQALDWESRLISALDSSEYRDLMRILEKLDRQIDKLQE